MLSEDATQSEGERVPLLAGASTVMGEAHLNLKQTNTSREQFTNALKFQQDYAPALNGIGKAFQADGMHAEAQAHFRKAIAADPRNPDYHLSLAISFDKYLKKTDESLRHYYTYLKLGGKAPNVKRWIGDLGGTVPEGY